MSSAAPSRLSGEKLTLGYTAIRVLENVDVSIPDGKITALIGANGSGKSTLARAFIAGDPKAEPNRLGVEGSPTVVDLTWYDAPTKADPGRCKVVEGYASPHFLPGCDVLVVGSYRTACGGLDAVPNFETSFAALDGAVRICRDHPRAEHQAIICEGVLSSTVWGSWADYEEGAVNDGVSFAFCYLDTPLEVCLERIRKRQEAAGKVREIKTELVADKVRAIAATREKALAAGALVYDLPHNNAYDALYGVIGDVGCARDIYRAR